MKKSSLALALGLVLGVSLAVQAKPKIVSTVDSQTCKMLLTQNPEAALKPELLIMNSALIQHYNVKEYTEDSTQRALKTYVEVIDSMGLLLTKAETDFLTQLPIEDLKKIHAEVFTSSSRGLFEGVLGMVIQRINYLIDKFSSDSSYRELAFARLEKYKTEFELKKTVSYPQYTERPRSTEEMESRFIEIFAFKMLKAQVDSNKKNHSGLQPLSDREVFVLAVREMRSVITGFSEYLNIETLPLLIAKSYITTLDPHSDLHLPKDSREMLQRMSSEMVGIGVNFTPDIKGMRIVKVSKGGPAETAGLLPGDIVTHITSDTIKEALSQRQTATAWLMLRNISFDDSRMYLGGKAGTSASLRILRDNKPIEIEVVREKIDLAESQMNINVVETPSGKVAHIQFDVFYHGVGEDMRNALAEVLKKHNISGVALDLRQNGGGSVPEVAEVLSIFIPKGPVFASKDNEGEIETLKINGKPSVLWDGPMIVMTDYFSASASEAVSGTLQDYGRAIVVGGESTFGKGSMQMVPQIGENIYMRITTSLFFTPAGRTPQKNGIISDVVLMQPKTDLVLERDREGVIADTRIKNLIPTKNQKPNQMQRVIGELGALSQARQRDSSDAKRFEQNTKESMSVLSDLIKTLAH